MKYENIKVIVAISICIGIFILFNHITSLSLTRLAEIKITSTGFERTISYGLFIGVIIAIIETIFLFIVIPILYLKHLNKIRKIK